MSDVIARDSEARHVDAFVNSLDLEALGFGSAVSQGRPKYSPRDLLKLYMGVPQGRALAEHFDEPLQLVRELLV